MDVDAEGTYELAVFPLGGVLFPSAVLPLHIFEPRYRALAEHLVARRDGGTDPEFGVVLIERGSEVGGGDVRSTVGTVARVVEAERFDDGRWGVVAVGVRRFRVVDWLPDDPWPRAVVADWPDDTDSQPAPDAYRATVATMRVGLALAAELGDAVAPPGVELTDDPALGTFQVAAVGPFGPADQHRFLCVPGAGERLAAIDAELADQIELLRLRLGGPPGRD